MIKRMATLHFLLSAYNGELNEVMPAIDLDNQLLNAGWEGVNETNIGNAVTVDQGDNALIMACYGGHLELVNALRVRGVDVHASNINKYNALIFACTNGHCDVAAVLLDAGVDVNAIAINGFTALHFAAYLGYHDFACCSYPEVQT